MSTLIELLIVMLVFGAILWIVESIPMQPPIKTGTRVVVAVIAIVVLLSFLPGLAVWERLQ